jgi:hypothetical protein
VKDEEWMPGSEDKASSFPGALEGPTPVCS